MLGFNNIMSTIIHGRHVLPELEYCMHNTQLVAVVSQLTAGSLQGTVSTASKLDSAKDACTTQTQHCQSCAHFMLLNMRYLSHLQHTQEQQQSPQWCVWLRGEKPRGLQRYLPLWLSAVAATPVTNMPP